MFRVAVLGRWRDVIKLVFLMLLPVFASERACAQLTDGAPRLQLASTSAAVGSVQYWSPEWVNSMNTMMVYDGESWIANVWVRTIDPQSPFPYTVTSGPSLLRVRVTPKAYGYHALLIHEGVQKNTYVYGAHTAFSSGSTNTYDDNLWFSHVDDSLLAQILRSGSIDGSLNWPIGGDGGAGDLLNGGNRPDPAPVDQGRIEWYGEGVEIDGSDDGSLVTGDGWTALVDDSSVVSFTHAGDVELPFPVPVLVSDGTFTPHVDAMMTTLVGSAWQSPPTDSTAGRFLDACEFSDFASMVQVFEDSANYARDTFAPAIFENVRRLGRFLIILWFVLYCWNVLTKGLGLKVRNIFAVSDDGDGASDELDFSQPVGRARVRNERVY